MLHKLLPVIGLTLAVSLPAVAAQQSAQSQPSPSATGGSEQQSGMSGNQTHMAISQRIKQDLEHAGFTNVQIMPESFLVRAHDAQGRPVMMVINPDSVVGVIPTAQPADSMTAL